MPSHFPQIDLTAPLTRRWMNHPLPKKREDAKPRIRLLVQEGKKKEVICIAFDKYGQKFKWPILDGKYLVRFQSDKKEIPLHVRLRSARQINYPGTNQPYSYEATLLLEKGEKVISMNHVHEEQGYRFYLANLLTSPSGINHIQLVVNYDPAKYFLTYPGAIILVCGIIFLYSRKRYV